MISYQESIRKKVQLCQGVATFGEIISRKSVADLCCRVEKLKVQARRAGSEEEYQQYHDQANELKKQLPCFIFQSTFPTWRRLQKDAVLNGLCMVDYDDIADPKATIDGWCAKFGSMTQFVVKNQIFLIHITPSGHGIRIVKMADAAVGNLADNQAHLDTVLGLKHDESCKDSSRVSYAFPKENLVFLNNEMFTFCNPEYDRLYGNQYRGGNSASAKGVPMPPVPPAAPVVNGNLFPVAIETPAASAATPAASAATKYRGVPYSQIISKWWELNGGEPQTGERNDKLLKLAASLRYICDQRPESVMAVMPRCGLSEEEVNSIVKNACHYAVYQSMPRPMRAVLESLGLNGAFSEADGNLPSKMNENFRLLQDQFTERFHSLHLPPAFRAVTSGVPDNITIGAVMASLPMFYTLATGITFRHFDGAMSRLSGMTFVIGPAASGKSFILELDELLMHPIRESDKAGRLLEDEYKRKKEQDKNKQKQGERPRSCIRIVPIQISNTKLAMRGREAKAEPDNANDNWLYHLYHIEAELATAVRAQKGGSWIEKNDIYCKAFHNERWGMDYANDTAVNGEMQVNLNMVVSGTEDAFDSLVNKNNIMGGLPTRLMYYPMPFEPFKMIPERRMRTREEQLLLSDVAMKLDTLRGRCEVDATPITSSMYEWCADKARLAELSEDYELDDLRKRAALIGERAGVIFAIIETLDRFIDSRRLEVSENAIAFARFIADFTLQAQYLKFASRMRAHKEQQDQSQGTSVLITDWMEIFNSLKTEFTTQSIINSYPNLDRKRIDTQMYRWRIKKLIESLNNGIFRKLVEKIERK